MNNDDEPARLNASHLIARIQASIVDNNNEIGRNFATGGMRITTVEESFSAATTSTIPTSAEDICVESDSVSPLSDEDGDDTVIERLSFTRIQIATGSNVVLNSLIRIPFVRRFEPTSTISY